MEWNVKAPPSWDFTELEQEPFSSLETVNGSNSFGDHKPGREDFSVDLKLGRVGNSANELVDTWKVPGIAKTTGSSLSGSSKRSRGSSNGSQAVSCLVDGCTADLSGCRDYHRRHKVCEVHSKTPQVTIGGHKQRFCQQCSRFHALEEFDEGKRSCRKRLIGHNRRRRKPQPEPFSRYGTMMSSYQAAQLLPFSSSLVYPSTAVMNQSWGGVVVKTEADSGLQNHHHSPQLPFLDKQNSMFLSPSSPATTKPFPLFQGHRQASPPEVSPLLRPFPLSETSSVADRSKLAFYGKLTTTTTTTTQVQNSECALSLLSSPQTSEMGLGHHNNNSNSNSNSNNMSHHHLGSFPLLHPSGLEQMSSVLITNGNEVHCPGTFHRVQSDGTSHSEPHQTLPFHWSQV